MPCRRARTGFAMPASLVTTQQRPQQTRTSSASAAAADDTSVAAPAADKSVYFFGDGGAEGTKDMKAILGGKGANLAEMTNLGVPVPPGFTIACAICIAYLRNGSAPDGLRPEVDAALVRLEK